MYRAYQKIEGVPGGKGKGNFWRQIQCHRSFDYLVSFSGARYLVVGDPLFSWHGPELLLLCTPPTVHNILDDCTIERVYCIPKSCIKHRREDFDVVKNFSALIKGHLKKVFLKQIVLYSKHLYLITILIWINFQNKYSKK